MTSRVGILCSVLWVASVVGGGLPVDSHAQTDGPDVLSQVGFDQKLGESIPLDLSFRDELGEEVTLGRYFGEKPVILALVYYECPMLCTLVLNGLLEGMDGLEFTAGREFQIVVVSFDPRDTPELSRAKKAEYLKEYGRPEAEAGWHFLTGSEESISALTQAVGFSYAWDEASKQFVHASGIMVLTPEGQLARYLYGIEYPTRDLKLGLIEAADQKIGSPSDQVLLFCFSYDPVKGKYGLAVMNLMRVLGFGTVISLAGLILVMVRRERQPSSA